MRNTIVVAGREIRARRLVFLTAPAWGLLVAIMGGLHHDRASVVMAAMICALVFGVVMSLVIGSTLIGGELAERRLSFYFARPISAASIWGGKFVGGLAVVVVAQLLVLAPSLVAYRVVADDLISLGVVTALSIGLLAIGIVLGIILRSKTAWVGLDLTVLVGAGLLTGLAWRIFDAGVFFTEWGPAMAGFSTKVVVIAAGVISIVMFVAGAAAVIVGRCDVRRAHRAASLVLLALIPAALAGVLWARWFVRPTGADITDVQAMTKSPNGEWFGAIARFRGRGPVPMPVLVSTDRKRIVHVGPIYNGQDASVGSFVPAFSADGRLAAWLASDADRHTATLTTVHLDDALPQPQRSKTLVFGDKEGSGSLQVSPTGEYAVLSQNQGTVFYRISDGAMILSVPPYDVRFTSPTHGTTYSWQWVGPGKPVRETMRGEFDLETRHYEKAPSRPTP